MICPVLFVVLALACADEKAGQAPSAHPSAPQTSETENLIVANMSLTVLPSEDNGACFIAHLDMVKKLKENEGLVIDGALSGAETMRLGPQIASACKGKTAFWMREAGAAGPGVRGRRFKRSCGQSCCCRTQQPQPQPCPQRQPCPIRITVMVPTMSCGQSSCSCGGGCNSGSYGSSGYSGYGGASSYGSGYSGYSGNSYGSSYGNSYPSYQSTSYGGYGSSGGYGGGYQSSGYGGGYGGGYQSYGGSTGCGQSGGGCG